MAGGNNNVIYMVFSRLHSARVAILWIMTALVALGLIMRGYVDQFCEDCREQDALRGKTFAANEGNIQRRDEARITEPQWKNSCLSVGFAPEDSQELMALPSYPGSGNTWLRHLIESSTGIYTGSVYKDKKLYSGGFRGEQVDYMKRTVLGVKMHRCSRRELGKFQSIIFLVRNPYNAMVAEWHRFHTTKHVDMASQKSFQTKEWDDFVEEESSHWERMMTNCIRESPRTLVVFYENLKENLPNELTQIHQFLRIPIDTDRLMCTLRNTEGQFHRSSHIDFDPFTAKMVAKINQRIESAAVALKDRAELKFPVDYRRLGSTAS